ncbi:urea transporter [Streptomyces sennicomposti]
MSCAGAPGPAAPARGFFAGAAQVFFLDRWYLGALLLAGLFLASRAAGAAACAGSAAGTATAWALGASAERIADGSLVRDAVLVALALCGVFLEASRPALLYAVLGAVTATVATPAPEALLAPQWARSRPSRPDGRGRVPLCMPSLRAGRTRHPYTRARHGGA